METKNIILLQAADGCKLYNEKDGTCVLSVLITDGNTSDWEEITDAEATALQAEWDAAAEAERNAEAAPTE